MINIDFIHIEPNKPEINNKVVPAARKLMEYKEHFDVISDGLSGINRFSVWEERFEAWKKANVTAPAEIFDIIERLLRQINNEKVFNDVRGAILEKVVEYSVGPRFNKPTCKKNSGCSVKINHSNIPTDPTITKKAVDYAAFDSAILVAEFYECKSHPQTFEEDNIRLFRNIGSNLSSTEIKDVMLGCVSYHNKRSMLRELKDRKKYDVTGITVIGKDELKSL